MEPAREEVDPALKARLELASTADDCAKADEDPPILTSVMFCVAKADEDPPILTSVMFCLEDETFAEDLLTTTCLSTSSTTVSRFDSAVAKTRALDLKAFKLLSASSALASEASNSLWNFFTRMILELEICSCSSNWRLYILIFSFNLSRDSCKMIMFLRSSSDCNKSALTEDSFLCKIVVVSTWVCFSLDKRTSNSSILISIFWMVRRLVATVLVSISAIRIVKLRISVSRAFLVFSHLTNLFASSRRSPSKCWASWLALLARSSANFSSRAMSVYSVRTATRSFSSLVLAETR